MNEEIARDNLSIEYIAGLFDGEGNVNISNVSNSKGKTKFKSIKAAITGSYRPMIESIFKTLKMGGFSTQKRQALQRTPKHLYTTDLLEVNIDKNIKLCKQGWRWTITSRTECKDFLTRIYPHLIEKKEQVRVALEFLDGKLDGEEALKLCREYKKFSFPANGFETARFNIQTQKGEKSSLSKLTSEQVKEIYLKYHKERYKISNLSDLFAVSYGAILCIVNGKTWKHITKDIVL